MEYLGKKILADVFHAGVLSFTASAAQSAHSPVEDEVVALFDEYREPLFRYLMTFGVQAADAEELLQDVFLALFLHLRSGKSRANLRGWLFRVAHNLALKRRQRERGGAFAGLPVQMQAPDPAPNPEDQLLRDQLQRRLASAYRALPERDRRCLWLRAEGLNYREIAAVLDISLGAVALSLARSLARLERCAER
jgi:RNA polymerase sigma-70 factor (ECF subfamily)